MLSAPNVSSQCPSSCCLLDQSSVLMLIWLSDRAAFLSAADAEPSTTLPLSALLGAFKADLSSHCPANFLMNLTPISSQPNIFSQSPVDQRVRAYFERRS